MRGVTSKRRGLGGSGSLFVVCEATVPENKMSRANKHHSKHRRRSDRTGAASRLSPRDAFRSSIKAMILRDWKTQWSIFRKLRLVSRLPHLKYASETDSEGPDNFDSVNQHRAARTMLSVKCYITICRVE